MHTLPIAVIDQLAKQQELIGKLSDALAFAKSALESCIHFPGYEYNSQRFDDDKVSLALSAINKVLK
jgi:hypothetical protein